MSTIRFGYKSANKYKAKSANGFPSKFEAAVYEYLLFRELAKEISEIKRQQTVYLTDAKIAYKVDFSYHDLKSEKTIWVEAKGFPTDVWRLKKRLWAIYGPGPLEIFTGNYKKPSLTETILPKNSLEESA